MKLPKNSATPVPRSPILGAGGTVGDPAANPRQHWENTLSVPPSATYSHKKVWNTQKRPEGGADSAGVFIGNHGTRWHWWHCFSQTTPRRPTAKTLRKLDRLANQAARWWAQLPTPKPVWLKPSELAQALKAPMAQLAQVLRALGWQRILRNVQRKRTTLWLPPGSSVKRRLTGGHHYRTYL